MKLLAYKSNEALRNEAIQTAIEHREADKLVKGNYWSDGKGCAIGCWAHTSEWPHKVVADKFSLPEELLYMVDSLFEQLPNEESQKWPQQFAEAIKPGMDLSLVAPKVMLWTLVDPKYGVIVPIEAAPKGKPGRTETLACIKPVAAIYREWIRSGEKPPHDCPAAIEARAAWEAWEAWAAWEARAAREAWEAWAARAAREARARAAREAREAWEAWAARAAREAREARAAWEAREAWEAWEEYTIAKRDALLKFISEAPVL